MNSHILSNAHIVTPTEDFEGSVVIEDGVIAEIVKDKNYMEGEDLHGLWLTPGCIDIHSDYLEKELHPRPGADFPLPMAFHFVDQRAAACGITTLYSAVSFSENDHSSRTFESAIHQSRELDELRNHAMVNHYLHARLDPNTDKVLDYLDQMKAIDSLQLVVYNDSIPGQRQYKLEDLIVKRAKSMGITQEEAGKILNEQIETLQKINHRPAIQQALGGHLFLGSHDDTTAAHVEEAHQYGATLSEMPTTLEAARRAKELGMSVCMGSPNYVRGMSHCGNLSCKEAMDEGLVDILCSDYHFPTMLTAVVRMIADGVSPSEAINYVSLYPARFLETDHETGSIEVGKTADLICVEMKKDYARTHQLWVKGYKKYKASYPVGSEAAQHLVGHA